MLDFIKDTDWYIAPHYFVRKLNAADHGLINSFMHDYRENYLDSEQMISKVTESLSSVKEDRTDLDKIFTVGLIDKRNAQLMGLICIKPHENNSCAELNLFLSAKRLASSVINELLIWLIDHTFYGLHFHELQLWIDKRCVKLVAALSKLRLECFEQLSPAVFLPNSAGGYSQIYHLNEAQWLNDKASGVVKFDHQEADQYIQEVIEPFFKTCISAPMYSTIIDFRYAMIMGTDQSARSIGLNYCDEAIGTGYKYYSRIDTATWYFGKWYNAHTAHVIHHYARKIFRIQQYVFKTGCSASYIDSLPYDRGIQSYLITFIPIFNSHGNVVALQSIASNYRLAGYHEYIQNFLEHKKPVDSIRSIKLSIREEEVLFLLICGLTQEQVAEILEIKRETVAAIIRNQLRVKFSLPIVNTKLIVETALAYGFPFSVPASLWRPSVIILEEKLANWIRQYT